MRRPALECARPLALLLGLLLHRVHIDISTGQIDALLSAHTGAFPAEKDQLLTTALAVSRWITVDDTGASPPRAPCRAD